MTPYEEDEVAKCQVTVKQGDKEIMRGNELEFFSNYEWDVVSSKCRT
nr:4446_t:CDS:2 [Entrophospora candida]